MSEKTRAEWAEACKGPGKFEGCEPWVPYFWEESLDGGGDEILATMDDDSHYADRTQLTPADSVLFPELDDVSEVVIVEDSAGFVYGFDSVEAYERWRG